MELARAIRVVFATFRRRPAQLLPFYLLGLAVPAMLRIIALIGAFFIAVHLFAAGRFETFRDELALIDTDPPDPETDPEAFVEWIETLQPLVETLVTPTTILVVLLTLLITIVGIVVLTAAVSAGQIATCFGLLRNENGIVRGIVGLKRHWFRFVGLYLLELFLWITVTGILVGIVAVSAVISPVLGLFVGILAAFLWLGIVVAIRAIFVFVPVSLVVDNTGIGGGIRGSLGFIKAEFGKAVVYYVIAIGVLLGWSGVSSTLATFGASGIAALGSLVLVAPALDLLKTVLFGDYRGSVDPPASPTAGVTTQVRRGLRRGIAEMVDFVRATPGIHALSLGVILIGFGMGWVLIEPLVEYLDASIRARLIGIVPPVMALHIFGNNWTVALTLAFSGVAFAIPAIAGLWFNGLVFGVYARLEVEPLVLLAFVIPHGILEIPAIIIAGALGISLGAAVWHAWRGKIDRKGLADQFEQAVWILFGIGIVLAVAAFLEGFVSPFYFRLFI